MTNGEIISLALTAGMFLVSCYMAFARRSQQREVSFDPGVATKEAFDRHTAWNAQEHEKIWTRMELDRMAQSAAATERSDKIYKQIDEVRKEVSAAMVAQTTELRGDMDGIPDRVIATLKNTGAI